MQLKPRALGQPLWQVSWLRGVTMIVSSRDGETCCAARDCEDRNVNIMLVRSVFRKVGGRGCFEIRKGLVRLAHDQPE
ncbi:MAG: hypothetical protein LCH98_20600 [Actinobacteria bacterium]|nr:hypothetical protein [Actinomycetota bacterium]